MKQCSLDFRACGWLSPPKTSAHEGVLRPPCSFPFIRKQARCTRWKIGYTERPSWESQRSSQNSHKFAHNEPHTPVCGSLCEFENCSVLKREQNAQIAHIRTMRTERPRLAECNDSRLESQYNDPEDFTTAPNLSRAMLHVDLIV